MTSALSCDDSEVTALAHWFLSSIEACFVVEAAEDVPQAYLVDSNEVVLVIEHLAPGLMSCCPKTLDCYCSQEKACSEVVLARDAV